MDSFCLRNDRVPHKVKEPNKKEEGILQTEEEKETRTISSMNF